jgi:hypothetical protein
VKKLEVDLWEFEVLGNGLVEVAMNLGYYLLNDAEPGTPEEVEARSEMDRLLVLLKLYWPGKEKELSW